MFTFVPARLPVVDQMKSLHKAVVKRFQWKTFYPCHDDSEGINILTIKVLVV